MTPLSLATLLLAALPVAASAADCPTAGTESATVAAAIDGDTLRLADGTVVRLAGIEAPKLNGQATGETSPLAAAATSALGGLIDGAAVGLVATSGTPDRYGRRHAYLFLSDGRSVAAEMLAMGLARARWLPGEGVCLSGFLAREHVARAAGLGIWADPAYAVRDAKESSLGARNGLYAIVEGRVISVGHGSWMAFIDFGRNYRSDFTIMVAPKVAEGLAAAGIPLDGLAGRRVRVRGVIEEAGGPAIRLNDPAEIELLDGEDGNDAGTEP